MSDKMLLREINARGKINQARSVAEFERINEKSALCTLHEKNCLDEQHQVAYETHYAQQVINSAKKTKRVFTAVQFSDEMDTNVHDEIVKNKPIVENVSLDVQLVFPNQGCYEEAIINEQLTNRGPVGISPMYVPAYVTVPTVQISNSKLEKCEKETVGKVASIVMSSVINVVNDASECNNVTGKWLEYDDHKLVTSETPYLDDSVVALVPVSMEYVVEPITSYAERTIELYCDRVRKFVDTEVQFVSSVIVDVPTCPCPVVNDSCHESNSNVNYVLLYMDQYVRENPESVFTVKNEMDNMNMRFKSNKDIRFLFDIMGNIGVFVFNSEKVDVPIMSFLLPCTERIQKNIQYYVLKKRPERFHRMWSPKDPPSLHYSAKNVPKSLRESWLLRSAQRGWLSYVQVLANYWNITDYGNMMGDDHQYGKSEYKVDVVDDIKNVDVIVKDCENKLCIAKSECDFNDWKVFIKFAKRHQFLYPEFVNWRMVLKHLYFQVLKLGPASYVCSVYQKKNVKIIDDDHIQINGFDLKHNKCPVVSDSEKNLHCIVHHREVMKEVTKSLNTNDKNKRDKSNNKINKLCGKQCAQNVRLRECKIRGNDAYVDVACNVDTTVQSIVTVIKTHACQEIEAVILNTKWRYDG